MPYFRKIIKIQATDSPNVQLALAQIAKGQEPTGEMLVDGVLSYADYSKRLILWDDIQKTVGLKAEFYEGAENLLFPPTWLDHSAKLALVPPSRRIVQGIGVDPAEGGDKTAMAAVDEFGLVELVSRKTPDTNVIPWEVLDFMRKYNVPAERVMFDRGGGGKQHADRLRAQGYDVRTMAFGETLVPQPKHGMTMYVERVDQVEERYSYVNRRAQMYGELSILCDPNGERGGWAFDHPELRRQLAPLPKVYIEGRLKMLPKSKRSPDSKEKTLQELLGCSPDEADAVVLAVHAMLHESRTVTAGGFS